MNTNDLHRSEHAVIAEHREQEHYDLPHGTCLGAGCCDWCGRPMGLVRQMDGTYKQRCNCGG